VHKASTEHSVVPGRKRNVISLLVTHSYNIQERVGAGFFAIRLLQVTSPTHQKQGRGLPEPTLLCA
jgi:hypothetical protein